MMHVAEMGVVATTFRKAGQAGLSYFTLSEANDCLALHHACGFAESVYLATCNRVAIFFVGKSRVTTAEYRRRIFQFFAAHSPARKAPFADAKALSAYAGEGAVEHLFVVAAALDSMVPGEAQILGQVKAALRAATAAGLAGPLLQDAFADAFAIAKQVRSQTSLGAGRTSMFSLVTGLLTEQLARVRAGRRARVAVVGVGDMAEQCGAFLQQNGQFEPLFVNRTLAKAAPLADRYGGSAVGLEAFLRAPGELLAVVTATSSKTAVLDGPFLAKLDRATLLVDLSVERDVDLSAAQKLALPLWDIDRLQHKAQLQAEARRAQVGEARARIDVALEKYRARLLRRSLGGALAELRASSEALMQRELALLPELASQPAVAPMVRRLLNKWLHGPTLGLKAVGEQYGLEAVERFVGACAEAANKEQTAVGLASQPTEDAS